jgi:hypothetical protein
LIRDSGATQFVNIIKHLSAIMALRILNHRGNQFACAAKNVLTLQISLARKVSS